MTQVILVDDDKQLVTILRTNLFKKYGWQVLVKETANEAISMLQILSDIELIITRDTIGREHSGTKICDYLVTNKADFEKEIPVLIMGTKKTAYTNAIEIDPKTASDKIIIHAGVLLGVAEWPKEPEPPKVIAPAPIPASPTPTPASSGKTQTNLQAPKPQVAPQAKAQQPQQTAIAPKIVSTPFPEEDYSGLSIIFYLHLDGVKIPFDSL